MRAWTILVALACYAITFQAKAAPFNNAEAAAVNAIAARALASSGAPSASIAVVRNGELAFAKAYGRRSLASATPATVDDRYDVGSISKQFTAAAILMLAHDGKVSLDDKVERFLPELTAADRISLRQLLSQTSGYRGFFTLEITPVEARLPISPRAIADRWGRTPLDFEPGTRWAYSNTGYTLAGLAVEQASGVTLAEFLRAQVFAPLGMTSAGPIDQRPLSDNDARGYTHFALGPPREAKPVATGWTFAAGGLGMTAADLARWDIAMIQHRLLPASAWRQMQTQVKLADGEETGYGLGVYVDRTRGVARIHHDGSTEGFLADNRVYPDARAAVVVLVNADYGDAHFQIARDLEGLLFPTVSHSPVAEADGPTVPRAPEHAEPLAATKDLLLAKTLYHQVSSGTLDRAKLSEDLNAYFSDVALADYRHSLSRLGEPQGFTQLRGDEIGGLRASLYQLSWPDQTLIAVMRVRPDGKVASFVVFRP